MKNREEAADPAREFLIQGLLSAINSEIALSVPSPLVWALVRRRATSIRLYDDSREREDSNGE